MANFVSAKALSANVTRADIYVGTRADDYAQLCAQFSGLTEEEGVTLPNKYSVVVQGDGSLSLISPDSHQIWFFRSWTQFAAYYLATFG